VKSPPTRQDKSHLAIGQWIRKEKRYAIYIRDGWHCLYCERDLSNLADGQEVTLDHLSEAGGNHESNLVTACKSCNNSKAGYSVESFASGTAKDRIAKSIVAPLSIRAAREFLATHREKIGEFIMPEAFCPPRVMANMVKMTDKELFELAKLKTIEPPSAKGYDLCRTLLALFLAKQESDVGSMDALKMKNLKQKIELDDIKILREAGDLVPVDWAKQLVAHLAISVCAILRASDISSDDKKLLTDQIEAINFENYLSQLRIQIAGDVAGESGAAQSGVAEGSTA
jgi:hypothetical protein